MYTSNYYTSARDFKTMIIHLLLLIVSHTVNCEFIKLYSVIIVVWVHGGKNVN